MGAGMTGRPPYWYRTHSEQCRPYRISSRLPLRLRSPIVRIELLPHFCPTSKMSHGLLGRDSCSITVLIRLLHFEGLSVARGVTERDVGSGALLGFGLFIAQ